MKVQELRRLIDGQDDDAIILIQDGEGNFDTIDHVQYFVGETPIWETDHIVFKVKEIA